MKMKPKIILLVLIILVGIIVGLYFYTQNTPIKGPSPKSQPKVTRSALKDNFNIEKVVDARGGATGIVFTPDGRMLFSELNSGFIRSYKDGVVSNFAKVPNHLIPSVKKGEAGLMGMTIDPDFENYPFVYVYYSSNGTSKIARYKDVNNFGKNFTIIFDGIKQGKIHNGGDMNFGHDGKLYVSTGDATDIKLIIDPKNPAQNISKLEGKILRMNRDGSLPEDNPFKGYYTFAYGLRNMFGFTIHPKSGKIYGGDNGINCCDEINIVESGKNYGWPFEMGFVEGSSYAQPIYAWDAEGRVGPTGMTFYTGDKFPEFNGNLFMGTWRTREIYRFVLDGEEIKEVFVYSVPMFSHDEDTTIESIKAHKAHGHNFGGILDVVQDSDGNIYYSDMSGIYKLTPK